ncbi:TraC family protein [Aliarcobacter butzleri]|uniref:TraC family protein n=1 Tax=Aliarcobacter butzleri TaxID=28197 RepID=UPI001EDADE2E|nr:TraC family protein [Aliarcobacter butzleri]MCG3705827.1 TraC family protein [Aliarcobacter butzleri]MCT7566877.1 TraC family protein [Aliarcobacter butzleri]MCT7575282.1 TraC family protein [Aliarcobacter butzleri]MDN5072382.1 TraC family protein [Aliarcobacter butzleri]MDN5086908.1 TraC family protein [Aliarcobacter butzleri]
MSINPTKWLKDLLSNDDEDFSSLPTKKQKELFKRYSVSQFIRPIAMSEKSIVCNDGYFGFIFECVPHIRAGTKTAETIESILKKLSDDIFMQINLWGSKNIETILNRWEYDHHSENETINEAIKKFGEFFRNKTNEQISYSMETSIKNHRLFFSFKSKDEKKLLDVKNHIKNILATNSFFPVELELENLKPIFWELLNPKHSFNSIPKYDSKKLFNKQVVSSENIINIEDTHIKIGRKNNANSFVGKSWITLSPASLSDYAHIQDFGKKLGDYISQACNTNQFNDTFMVTLNVNKVPRSENISIGKKQNSLVNKRVKNTDTKLLDKKAEAQSVNKRLKDFEPLFNMDLVVLIAGENYELADKNATSVQTFWASGGETSGIVLGRNNSAHLPIFLNSLPLGLTKDYFEIIQGNPFKLFADQVAPFAPVEADYKGNYPNNLFISKRGQLTGFDFFQTSASKNGYIIARSGAGKSVLLNYMVLNAHTRGDRIFITDIGGSYEPICAELGGQYIEIDLDKPISFNPFSDLKELTLEDLNFFSDWIYSLGASKLKSEALKLQNIIKPKLQEIIRNLFDDLGSNLEISDIRDGIKKIEDSRYQDFAIALTPFCKGELYGDFLTGKSQINLNNQLAVLELGKVENIQEIRDAMIFIWEYHKSNAVYKQEKDAEHGGRRILVIIDEVHKFLGKNEMMDDAIEQAYRRFRKHLASIWIATQSFEDINNNDGLTRAGRVILANSPWKIFLGQEETSLNMLFASSAFKFDHIEEQLIRAVTTVKPEYSELFIITPEQQKIPYRLVMNKYFYYLTTTDQDDKRKVYNTMKLHNLSKKDAINYLIEEQAA